MVLVEFNGFFKEDKLFYYYENGQKIFLKRYRLDRATAKKLDNLYFKKLQKELKATRKNLNPGCITKRYYQRILKLKLVSGDCVHHIDCNPFNNSKTNLLVTNKSEHRLLHGQLEQLARTLLQNKYILFDHSERKYKFNEEVFEVVK